MKNEVTLIDFLRKNRLLRKFKANYKKNYYSWTFDEYVNKFSADPKAIKGAFVWSSTPEGLDYWSGVSRKWNVKLEKSKK
jgi:hypothetical protein